MFVDQCYLPSQAKMLLGAETCQKDKSTSHCLLNITAFDRIVGLSYRYLSSNRGYAYAKDFEERPRALNDHAKD